MATNSSKEAKGIGASYALTTGLGLTKFALLSATNTSYSTTASLRWFGNNLQHRSQ